MKIDIYPLQTINMKKNFALRLVLKAWFCSVLFIERKMQFRYVTVALRGTKVITYISKELHDTAVHHSSVLTKLLIVIATFFINKRRTKVKLVPNESFVVVWQVITL